VTSISATQGASKLKCLLVPTSNPPIRQNADSAKMIDLSPTAPKMARPLALFSLGVVHLLLGLLRLSIPHLVYVMLLTPVQVTRTSLRIALLYYMIKPTMAAPLSMLSDLASTAPSLSLSASSTSLYPSQTSASSSTGSSGLTTWQTFAFSPISVFVLVLWYVHGKMASSYLQPPYFFQVVPPPGSPSTITWIFR